MGWEVAFAIMIHQILVKNLWSPESPGPGETAATRAAAGHGASRDVSHSRRQKGAQAVLRPGRPSGFHTDCFEEVIVLRARRPTGGSEKHSGTGAVSPRVYAPHSKSAPEPKARDANGPAAYTR